MDETTEHRRVLDDLRVVPDARDGRRRVLQLDETLDAADLVEQSVTSQLVGDGHGVGRIARREQRADRVVDVLVGRSVEVVRVQTLLGDRRHRLRGEEEGTED